MKQREEEREKETGRGMKNIYIYINTIRHDKEQATWNQIHQPIIIVIVSVVIAVAIVIVGVMNKHMNTNVQ